MTAYGPSRPVLESLEYDDPDTTVESTPYQEEPLPDTERAPEAPRRNSYIRLRPPPTPSDVARYLESLHDEQISLMVDLVCLEHSVTEIAKVAPAELAPLRRRVADLADVRAAMSDLLAEPMPRMLVAPRANLGVYLRGLFVWCANAVAALDDFAAGVCAREPDRTELRARLHSARETHFDALAEDIRADVIALKIVYTGQRDMIEAFQGRLDELLWTAWWLQRSLESLS
jgi:hypothetical protein